MAVYVDPPRYPYGRMVMCHMIADSLGELHAMADAIGVRRKWFQGRSRFPHYDICKSKRALAVSRGAVEVSGKELARIALRHWPKPGRRCRISGRRTATACTVRGRR